MHKDRILNLYRPIVFESAHHVTDSRSWHGHIPFAFWCIDALRPKLLVELGTHKGDSYCAFSQAVDSLSIDSACFAIDTWKGNTSADVYSEEVYEQLKAYHDPRYGRFSRLVRTKFYDALGHFNDHSIDLLHIDGLYPLDTAMHDFETWLPKLSERSVVLVRNINVKETEFEVRNFWEGVSKRYPHFAFQHCNGLGVLVVGQKPPDAIKPFVKGSEQEEEFIRAFFSRLGEAVSLTSELAALKRGLEADHAEIARRDETTAKISTEISMKDEQIAVLASELERRKHEKDLILSSRSWRVTAPLRTIKIAWYHSAALTIDIARRPAYYAQKMKGGYRLWRKDGYKAVISRLKRNASTPVTQRTYQDWINEFDRIDDIARAAIRKHIDSFHRQPKISILIPVYNTPEKWLRRAIDSVREQLYTNWELCIADDASPEKHVRRVLEEYASQDARIKVVFRQRNGHISAASNSALELATGEYFALLDHDDELSEHALYMVALEVIEDPNLILIFSDEDKINEKGTRFDPNFKPNWNLTLFLGQNCICHLGVYEAKHVRAIGGFREGYEGSQDYDLALRVIEGIQPRQIRHIPHILYHWRAIPGSTAQAGSEKDYSVPAARRAVSDFLKRQEIVAEVLPAPTAPAFQRVRYKLKKQPLVSIIIPTRDGYEILRRCLESLQKKTDYQPYEVVIIDNQTSDPQTLAYLQELDTSKAARVLRYDEPFNFSAINNFAVERAEGEVLCLLNNDTEVISTEWLTEMVSHALRPGVGAVGAKLLYPDGRIQHAGVILGIGGVAGHAFKNLDGFNFGYFGRAVLTQELSAVTGGCLVLRRELYENLKGLDEDRLSVAFNDIDLCIRLQRRGYRNVMTPYALLYHHESVSRGCDDTPEKRVRFESEVITMRERWGSVLLNDPHYNPNLSLNHEDFSIAWPPRTRKPWKTSERSCVENGLKHRSKGYDLLRGQGVEIGAFHQPAPVPNSCVVEYCDAISKEDAIKLFPELDANDLVEPKYICDIDKEQLPFADGSLDFVILNHVIEHTANPIRVIKEIFRVTAPSGTVVLSAPDKNFTFDKNRQLTSFDHIFDEFQTNVTEVSDEHYMDFISAVHPEVLDLRPDEISPVLASIRKRREHAHVWNSKTFKEHLISSMKILRIGATSIYESHGHENRLEYFSVWRKQPIGELNNSQKTLGA